MQLYLIKSGPGLRQIHHDEAAGPGSRQGRSSASTAPATPDSLDGVVFCDKDAAILDATAPHTLEPLAPGADEVVVSLYHTISPEALRPHRDQIRDLFAQNAALRSRAARYIASAGSLMPGQPPGRGLQHRLREGAPLRQAAVRPPAAPPGRGGQRTDPPPVGHHPPGAGVLQRHHPRPGRPGGGLSGRVRRGPPASCWSRSAPRR